MHVKPSGGSHSVADVEGRTKKAEQGEATRAELVRVARELFAERGYAGVDGGDRPPRRGWPAARATTTSAPQGPLSAVHEQLERELVESIGERIAGVQDARELLASGVRSFLDACTDPALAQISLIDAPSVLGWAAWREVDARYGMGLVRLGLEAAIEQGTMPRQDPEPLAHLVLAALGEAALLIAHADDPRAARREIEGPVLALLEGLSDRLGHKHDSLQLPAGLEAGVKRPRPSSRGKVAASGYRPALPTRTAAGPRAPPAAWPAPSPRAAAAERTSASFSCALAHDREQADLVLAPAPTPITTMRP